MCCLHSSCEWEPCSWQFRRLPAHTCKCYCMQPQDGYKATSLAALYTQECFRRSLSSPADSFVMPSRAVGSCSQVVTTSVTLT
jgi:hypothetical protein